MQGPVVEIDGQVYDGYIVSDKAMKVRMFHYELKWEILEQWDMMGILSEPIAIWNEDYLPVCHRCLKPRG